MIPACKIVGIINVTPDSFSGSGILPADSLILEHAKILCEDRADILDIGAESTRPGARSLTHEEEWQRLQTILPQICQLARRYNIKTSIDTRHLQTAKNAIDCGIDWINDVSGAENNEMVDLIARNPHIKYVIMHNLGIPANKNITIAATANAVETVKEWFEQKLALLKAHGIPKDRVILDPGIGFGKTAEQSWNLINHIKELKQLGAEILIGHSRKSFLDFAPQHNQSLPHTKPEERLPQTLAVSGLLIKEGIEYLRVHDVREHKELRDSVSI